MREDVQEITFDSLRPVNPVNYEKFLGPNREYVYNKYNTLERDRAQRWAKAAAIEMEAELRANPPEFDVPPHPYLGQQTVHSVTERSDITSGGPPDSWRSPTRYSYSKRRPFVGPLLRAYHTRIHGKYEDPNLGNYQVYCEVRPDYRSALPVLYPERETTTVASNKGALEFHAMRQVKSNSMQAAMALYESRQSIQLLGEYVRRIAGIAKAVRQKDPRILKTSFKVMKKDRRFSRKSSDLWLETIYGLMPLMSDVSGLGAALARGLREKEQLLVARTSSTGVRESSAHSWDYLYGENMSGPPDDPNWRFDLDYKVETKLDEHVNLWFKVDDPRLVMLKEIGFTNPLALAWDAVPLWSLLIDWVYPVGQFLDLLDYDLGLTWKGGAFTSFTRRNVSFDAAKVRYLPTSNWSVGHSTPNEDIVFERYPYISPPQPAPPSLRNPFQVTRAVSAVALLRQRLK